MGFLVLLCAHYANADETELIPLKNELKELITEQEERNNIPSGLLLAIATVESGSKPYALNIQGKSVIGRNKREAVDLIHEALAEGITNIDVGVMQLNVRWHRENFGSIEEMLEPKKNIEYAASFLLTLYKKYGDWHRAVRFYHSSTAEYYRKYSRKITMAWLGV
jgi:soluble lytic murein transglycosylase-like protein